MEVVVLACLILLNGVFAMSEIAVVAAKQPRLQMLADQGSVSAASALRLARHPTQFLSTVQIGITSIGILNGIYGESVFAQPFALWMQEAGVAASTAGPLATALVVIVVTYLSIVVGELVPKRIGQMNAERIACLIAAPMRGLAVLAVPFVKVLSVSTQFLLLVLGFRRQSASDVTEEDIHALLSEGSSAGVIEQHEHEIVKHVFRFDERPVSSLMIPRSEMIFLDASLPLQENYRRMMEVPHTLFPVCDQSLDNLFGIVNAKDVLATTAKGIPVDLRALATPGMFVPPGLNAMELLKRFRVSDFKMAFIVDEYGDIKGLITLQDLLEALTGDFWSEEDEEAFIIPRADGSYLLDGLLPVIDVKDLLDLADLPADGSFQTLGGMLMASLDKLPSTGDSVDVDRWHLEIVDMDGRRIDKVLASRIAQTDSSGMPPESRDRD